MIVLLAGMPRSGSTFSFNVVRGFPTGGDDYRRTRARTFSAGASFERTEPDVRQSPADDSSNQVADVPTNDDHSPSRRGCDGLMGQHFRGGPQPVLIEIMRRWLRMFRVLRNQALIVTYREIDSHPWLAAWRIARAVCPKVGPMEVLRIARRLDKTVVKRRVDQMQLGPGVHDGGWTYFDTQTSFHRRHSLRSRPDQQRTTCQQSVCCASEPRCCMTLSPSAF